MEAEKEEDPFASIIKLCRPTASQEAKFPCCPLARQSENFLDSQPDPFSSSTDPTASEPTGIFMVSLPPTPSPVQQHVEDDAVFHTPPEHHANSHLSSSKDQNVNELCVEGVAALDEPDRVNKVRVSDTGLDNEPEAKKIRVLEENLDGDTVPVGETEVIEMEVNQVVDDTEVIIVDSHDSDDEITTVNLGEDSLDITSGGLMIDIAPNIDELVIGSKSKVDAVNGSHELGRRCESLEDTGLNKSEKSYEKSGPSGSFDSGKGKEDIAKLKCIAGNICIEVEQKSGVGGSEKIAKIAKDANMPKDCYQHCLETDGKRTEKASLKTEGKRIKENGLEPDGNRIEEIGQTDCNRIEETGLEIIHQKVEETVLESDGKKIEETGLITDGKRIEEIGLGTDDKRIEETVLEVDGKRIEKISRETNGKKIEEIGRKTDGKRSEEVGLKTNGNRIEDIDEFRYTGGDDSRWKGRRRQLPASLQGKEKEVVGNVETKHGLMDFLDVLKAFVGNADGGCEDLDFLDTAKRRGLTFPRPRWWASEGSDE